MSFMEPEVTEWLAWRQVDTPKGLISYPTQDFTCAWVASKHNVPKDDVKGKYGFGARLSAPGYLDCIECAVFDTEEEAEKYLSDRITEAA